MTFTQITSKQEVDFTLDQVTDEGIPVDKTPAPVWSLETGPTDPATISVNVDGFSGTFSAGTAAGDSVFLCQAFVGGVPVSEEVTVTVTIDARTGKLLITFGVPRDKATTPVK